MSSKRRSGNSQERSLVDNRSDEDLSTFSAEAQAVIQNKENLGHFEHPDLTGKIQGCCGDSIQIDLLLDGKIIIDACYTTDGCFATMACGGMITRLIKGKSLEDAEDLDADRVIQALGGLPRAHIHCANLAVNTLHKVILQGRLNGNDAFSSEPDRDEPLKEK